MAESSRKCYLHIVDDAKSDIKPLTSKRLKTLVDRIKDWKGLYGKQHDIALILESNGLVEFVDENIDLVRLEDAKQRYPDFGFHDECYQKFTNISIINKVQILTYFTMHQNVLPTKNTPVQIILDLLKLGKS